MNRSGNILFALSGMYFLTLFALQGAPEGKIVTPDGKVIKTRSIKLRPQGELEYVAADGTTLKRLSRERYRYAWTPKPAAVTHADQVYKEHKYKEGAALYKQCAVDFKLLGWEIYCIRMEAECLAKSGEKLLAQKRLKELHNIRILNEESREELFLADDLLSDLLIDARQYDDAMQILRKQMKLEQKDLVFSAFFKQAVIKQNLNRRLEAAKSFYRTALLFPTHERRTEALYNAWSLFTELKNPAAEKIAELLKKQYPDDVYTKRIFL